MKLEIFEDEMNVYLCVLDRRSACLGIARVGKDKKNAHEQRHKPKPMIG